MAFVAPPVLVLPDITKSFVVYTAASGCAVGVVLTQRGEDGKEHPNSFASRALRTAERKYSAFAREVVALIFGLQKFRKYLLVVQFVVVTDHQALTGSFVKSDMHGRLVMWPNLMAKYDFEIYHKPGTANAPADYLSRMGEPAQVESEAGDLAAHLESYLGGEYMMMVRLVDTLGSSGSYKYRT